MLNQIQGLQSNFKQYVDHLPEAPFVGSAKSFLWSYSITFVLSGINPSLSLINGVLGATASLVDSFTKPLFSEMFSNSSDFVPLILRKVIVVSLIGTIASTMGSAFLGVHLVSKIVQAVLINLLLETLLGNQELLFRNERVVEAPNYFYFNFL